MMQALNFKPDPPDPANIVNLRVAEHPRGSRIRGR